MKRVRITIELNQPLLVPGTEEVIRALLGQPLAFGYYPDFSQERVKVEEVVVDEPVQQDTYTDFNGLDEFVIITPSQTIAFEEEVALRIAHGIIKHYQPKDEVMHHTANVRGADAGEPKLLRGEFSVVDGKLSFTCTTRNVTFDEVKAGLQLLRDELNRQFANQQQCPFHPEYRKDAGNG